MKTRIQPLQFAAVLTLLYALPCVKLAAAEEASVKSVEIFKRAHPNQADQEIIVKRIELKPGAADLPHVHAGMIVGYIEAGTLEFQLEGEPLEVLKAGETFFELPGSHHMVAHNPDPLVNTVIIAFIVNPKGVPVSTPLK